MFLCGTYVALVPLYIAHPQYPYTYPASTLTSAEPAQSSEIIYKTSYAINYETSFGYFDAAHGWYVVAGRVNVST